VSPSPILIFLGCNLATKRPHSRRWRLSMWVSGTTRNLGVVCTKWLRPWSIEPCGTPLFGWDHRTTHGLWLKRLCYSENSNWTKRMDHVHFLFFIFLIVSNLHDPWLNKNMKKKIMTNCIIHKQLYYNKLQ